MADQEQRQVVELVKTVGEMPVDDFMALLQGFLNNRRGKGDERLIDLSVKEFFDSMLEYQKTRTYQTATVEAHTAEQILTDWSSLKNVSAVTQPFRVRSASDVKQLSDNLEQFFVSGGQGEMIVAVAVVTAEGGVVKFR